jgi:hypothetical protein
VRASLSSPITPSLEVGELGTLVETLKRGPLGAGPRRLDGGNNYAESLNDRLVVHSSSAPLVKRSWRLLGGMAGREGLVALVGLHLAGRQFKGHGELGSRKRYIRKGAGALLGAGTRTQGVLSHTVHVPYVVLPLSKPFIRR